MQADDLANNAGNIAKPVNNTITTFKTVYNTVNYMVLALHQFK